MKKFRKLVMYLLVFTILISNTSMYVLASGGTSTVAQKPTKKPTKVMLQSVHEGVQILQHNNSADKTSSSELAPSQLMWADTLGNTYPAYCLNPNTSVEDYKVTIKKNLQQIATASISDTGASADKVMAALQAGWPAKTPAELGFTSSDDASNTYQAYYATKMAVWAIIHKKYSDLDSFTINPSVKGYQSDQVLVAMKQIVSAGLKNSVMTTPKIRILDNTPSQTARRDEIDKQSLSKTYTVFGLPKGTYYKVSFTKPQKNGVSITSTSNEKIENNTFSSSEGFKIIIPASAVKKGTFTCSIKVQGIVPATKVVYMQSSSSKENQNFVGITSASITATAKFTTDPSKVSPKTPLVTVSFVTGDAPKITPLSVEKGQSLGSLPVTSSSTGTFIGWFTDKSLKKQFFNDTPVVKNITVYPKFISAEVKPKNYIDPNHFVRNCDPDFTITIKSAKPITTKNLSQFATIEAVINTAPPLEVTLSNKANDEYIISAKGGWPLGGLFSIHLIDSSITFYGLDPQVRSESFELKAAPVVNKLNFKNTNKFIPWSDVDKVNDTTYKVKSKYGPFHKGDIICVSDNNDKKTNLLYGKILTDASNGDIDLITIEKPKIEDILNSMEFNSGIQDLAPKIVNTKQIEQDIVKQAYKSEGMNQIFKLLGAATAATPTFYNDSMKYNGSYSALTFPSISPNDITCSIQTVDNSKFHDYPTTDDSTWCLLTLKGKVTRKINQISVSCDVTITQAIALNTNTKVSWSFGDLAPNLNEKVYVCLDTNINFSVKLSLEDKEDGTIDLTPQVQEAMKTGANLISGNTDTENKNLPEQNLPSTYTMSNAIENLKETIGEAPNYVNVVDQEIMKPKTSIDGIIDIEFPISFVVNLELLAGLTSNTHLMNCVLFTVTSDSNAHVNVSKEEYLPFRYDQDIFAYGAFGVQCGMKGGINIGPAGITSELHIGASIEVGAYLEGRGFFHLNVTNYLPGRIPDGKNFTFYTYNKPRIQFSGGMYIEIGVYCNIAVEAQFFMYKAEQSLFGMKIPLVSFGEDNFMEFFEDNPSYLHIVGGSLDPSTTGIYNSKWFNIKDLSETDYKNNTFPAGVKKGDFKIYFDNSRFKIADNGCIEVDLSKYQELSGKEYAVANMTVVYTGNKLSLRPISYTIPVLYDKEKIDTKGQDPLTVYKVNYLIDGEIVYTEKVYVGHKALGFKWTLVSSYELNLMSSIKNKYKDNYEPFSLIPPSYPIYKDTNIQVDLTHKVRDIGFQYLSSDGNTWLWTYVPTNYGDIPVPPAIPNVYGYTPRGWHKELTAASVNSSWGYIMTYDPKLYNITFNVPSYTAFGKTFPAQSYPSQQQFGRTLRFPDGMGLGSGTKGIMISFPDANVFVDKVKGDKTYDGKVTFGIDTVNFVDHDGNIIDTQTGPYGSKLSFPAKIPQPIVENGNTYAFDYWYPNPSMDPSYAYFTGDLTYSPVYKYISTSTPDPKPTSPATSTITFDAGDGYFGNPNNKTVTKTYQKYTEFSDTSADIIPQKQSDHSYTYTFHGWDTFTLSNDYYTLTATYIEHMIPYTAIMDANGGQFDGGSPSNTYLDISYDDANTKAQTYTLVPTKASDENIYTFTGWEKKIENNNVIRYLAQYDTTPNMFSITLNGNDGYFTDGEGHSVSQLVLSAQYGTTIELPTPHKASTTELDFTWSSYVLSGSGFEYGKQITIQGNATYTAQYSSSARSYNVTFSADGGTFTSNSSSTKTVSYPYNTNLILEAIETPTKDDANYSYEFTGWSPALGTITQATTYTAQYSASPKVSVTFHANGGTFASNSLNTKIVSYPNGTELQSISIEAPSKAEDTDNCYVFTGWSPALGTVSENIAYTANYSAIPKHHELTISDGTTTEDISTLNKTILGYTYGINDDGILELNMNASGLTLGGTGKNLNVKVTSGVAVTFKDLTIDNSTPTGDVRSGFFINGDLTIKNSVNFTGSWVMIGGELTGDTLNINNAIGSLFGLCPVMDVNIHDITMNLLHTSIDGSDMIHQMTLDHVILNITGGRILTLNKDIVIDNNSIVTFLTTGEVITTKATVTITGNSTVNFTGNTGIKIVEWTDEGVVDKHDFGVNTTVINFMNDVIVLNPNLVNITNAGSVTITP